MKYLIIPGAPLLVVALGYHDSESKVFAGVAIIAVASLVGGSGFIIFYGLLRVLRFITNIF